MRPGDHRQYKRGLGNPESRVVREPDYSASWNEVEAALRGDELDRADPRWLRALLWLADRLFPQSGPPPPPPPDRG